MSTKSAKTSNAVALPTSKPSHVFDLTPVQALALGKLAAKAADECRDAVQPGAYTVSVDVSTVIEMTVGADCPDAIIAMAVPTWRIIAACFGRLNGVTVDAILRDAEAITDADEKATKASVTEALEALKGRARGLRRGAVKVAERI